MRGTEARNADTVAALDPLAANERLQLGAVPTGDIVILAVLFAAVVPIVKDLRDALADKIIIDITNPFNADAAPASTHVFKAFNTLFQPILASGAAGDVFMAGDDAQAKASVSAFIMSLGLRSRDVGDPSFAHWVEGAGLLEMGLAKNGLGFNFSLGVNLARSRRGTSTA
jgi:8-hydroxy-5-deazaflavin:NADPH oxidoreductase